MQKPNTTQLNAAKIQKCESFHISLDYNCLELQKEHPAQQFKIWHCENVAEYFLQKESAAGRQ